MATTSRPPHIDEATRRHMIEEAAYYLAERRGFQGGDPHDDWLLAERQVDEQLTELVRQRREEITVYRKMRGEVRRLLGEARGTIGADTITAAIDRASRNLKDVGEQSVETVNRVATALQRDMAAAAGRLGPTWESVSGKTADLFEVWRDRGSKFLGRAGAAVSEWVHQVRGGSEPLYRTGDLTCGGTFECRNCRTHVELDDLDHLPECPNCHGQEFRQV